MTAVHTPIIAIDITKHGHPAPIPAGGIVANKTFQNNVRKMKVKVEKKEKVKK
jgi:hypothetical protein